MTRTLESSQTRLAASANVHSIILVKLTTYSDKDAGTIDTVYYIAKRAVKYDYEQDFSFKRFEPWLDSVVPIRSSIVHVPGSRSDALSSRAVSVDLNNLVYSGSRVAAILSGHTLEGADVEIAKLLLPARNIFEKYFRYVRIDLLMDGSEHTVVFRGSVDRVITNSQTITLECETDLPNYKWATINDESSARPRDIGLRMPIPYGINVLVGPLPSWDVGWVTTTRTAVPTDTYTGEVGVVDATGFPSGSFIAIFGTEAITCTKTSDTTISLGTRGSLSTTKDLHTTGLPISELQSSSKWIVSRYRLDDFQRLYIRNPLDQELVEIPEQYYTSSEQDTTIISGEEVHTVSMTQQNLYDFLGWLQQQQPTTAVTASESSSTVDPNGTGSIGANAIDGSTGTSESLTGGAGYPVYSDTVRFTNNPAMDRATVRVYLSDLSTIGIDGWVKLYYGLTTVGSRVFKVTKDDADGWYEYDIGTADDFTLSWKGGTSSTCKVHVVERVEYTITEVGGLTVQSEVNAATIGINAELYALVDGVSAPVADFGQIYDFEDSGTWNTDGCTQARDTVQYYEGVASRKMTLPVSTGSPTLLQGFESAFVWQCSGGSVGVSFDETQGTFSMGLGTNLVYGDNVRINAYHDDGALNWDLTDTGSGIGLILMDVKSGAAPLGSDPTNNWEFYLGNTTNAPFGSDHYRFDFADNGQFPKDVWVTVVLDYREADATSGTPNPADIDSIGIDWRSYGLFGRYLRIDNIRMLRVGATVSSLETSVIQNNAVTSSDMSSFTDEYALWVRQTGLSPGESLDIQMDISQSAGTGTTTPSSRREITFDGSGAADGVWTELPSSGINDVSSPNVAAVVTIRIAATYRPVSHGIWSVGDASNDIILNFDNMLSTQTLTNDYEAGAGEVLELGVDVARHWIEVIGGASMDATSLATSVTNLGTNILGGDARGWGSNYQEVLSHIGYLTRSNFFPEETSTGTVWKMLQAESDYTWPASGGTLDLFQEEDVVDAGRDRGLDLFSGRLFLYSYAPNLGGGDEAYRAAIRIGSDQNDASAKVSAGTISTAVAAFGEKEAPVAFLLGVNDSDTAIEVSGYYYTEGARTGAKIIFIRNLSHSQGYALEVGDIRDLVLPWVSGTKKIRIIEIQEDLQTLRYEISGVVVT